MAAVPESKTEKAKSSNAAAMAVTCFQLQAGA
jgi:hypothetical protein